MSQFPAAVTAQLVSRDESLGISNCWTARYSAPASIASGAKWMDKND